MRDYLENHADDGTFDRVREDNEADAKALLLEIVWKIFDRDCAAERLPSGEKVLFAIGDRPASLGGTGFFVSGECTGDQWPIIEAVIETARHMASELAPKMQAEQTAEAEPKAHVAQLRPSRHHAERPQALQGRQAAGARLELRAVPEHGMGGGEDVE